MFVVDSFRAVVPASINNGEEKLAVYIFLHVSLAGETSAVDCHFLLHYVIV